METSYDNRRLASSGPTNYVIASELPIRHLRRVLDTDELLSRLEARGVRNVDIARVLGLPDSRVPEIRKKKRALKLDEAVKLVQAFGLESDRVVPLPGPIVRLVVLYLAEELGTQPRDDQIRELTEDVRAFAAFVANPRVRRSAEAAESFFEALRLRRPESGPEAPSGSDRERSH
jgi:hypothetical protein